LPYRKRVRSEFWLVLALVLPVAAVAFPVLVLPAIFAVLLAILFETGRRRLFVSAAGGLLVTVASVRFVFVWMLPNLVGSGQHIAEEEGLSHLREIRWAEEEARRLRAKDVDHNGEFEYATLDELVELDHEPPLQLRPPPLSSSCFHLMSNEPVYKCQGYRFAVYLPRKGGGFTAVSSEVDPHAASRRFLAYAWPEEGRGSARRAFFIDERDRICEWWIDAHQEISSPLPWNAGPLQGESCGQGGNGAAWRSWRHKAALPSTKSR
jgi:hypothetical protein